MEPLKEKEEPAVTFGNGNPASAFGILGGVAIALGVPWIILSQGQCLGVPAQLGISIAGLALGSLVSLTSAFFGLVMPSHVGGRMLNPEHWAKFAAMRHAHREARWRARWGRNPWEDGEDDDEAPPPPRRRKR